MKKIIIKITILSILIYGLIFFIKNTNQEEGFVLPSIAFRQVIREVNPFDLDWDGIPNTWEEQYGLNPNYENDGLFDGDNDGLINLDEYLNNTDPTNPDTDGGSLKDGAEITQGKNPLDPTDDITVVPEDNNNNSNDNDDNDSDSNEDIDNDNITTKEEKTIYKTNPTIQDSDYDGLTDYEEIFTYHTNPISFDTDNGGVSDGDEILNKTNPTSIGDDIQYYLNTYILEDKNNTLQSEQINKQICVSKEPFKLEFNTKLDIQNPRLVLNNKQIEIKDIKQTIDLECPTEGINNIAISFDVKNKTYHLTRKIESLPKGIIKIQYTGIFNKYYKYIPFYKPKILKNKMITIETIENKKYISDKYKINGETKINDQGEYYIILEPGMYSINVKGYKTINIEVTTKTPIIYNKDLYLETNGDYLFLGLISLYIAGTTTLLVSIFIDIRNKY